MRDPCFSFDTLIVIYEGLQERASNGTTSILVPTHQLKTTDSRQVYC